MSLRSQRWSAGVLLLTSSLLSSRVSAEVPHLIRYQGQAVDSQGVPLQGPYHLTFRLYDADTGGTVVWQEIQANVPITKGHFSILLGQVTALNVDWSKPCWLSTQIGSDPELLPRQRITSVPFALRAAVAEQGETGTWLNVTTARSFNATYRNTSGKKRRVSVVGTGAIAARAGLNLRVGMTDPPTGGDEINTSFNNAPAAAGTAHSVTVSGEVPANWYYNVGNVNGNETLTKWFELDE